MSAVFRINPRYNDYFHKDYEFENINKILFPRYPDSLKTPVRSFKKLNTYQLPVFSYPVPKPSFKIEINNDKFNSFQNYGQVQDFLTDALIDLEWTNNGDLTFFELPDSIGGFVTLARLEQIDAAGYSQFPPNRWEPEIKHKYVSNQSDFIRNYMESLIAGHTGSYRVIAILVTKGEAVVNDPNSELRHDPRLNLLEAGSYKLSDSVRDISYKDHNTTLLVYEFKKVTSHDVEFVNSSIIDHYSTSGLLRRFTAK